jgi:lipopolysaccharide/colanic/teichoic acid biosynthesis glycosyltransferase
MIRFFDVLLSAIAFLLLLPLLLILAIAIKTGSKGPVFFFQRRVGKDNRDFTLIKFRTMHSGAEKSGSLTVGTNDSRITGTGLLLRKYKLDELPQLLNVIRGDMSLVGPRPEVRKYVDLYTADQRIVLSVRPGLTDWASLEYLNENEILGSSPDPEKTYIGQIMPAKIELNKQFLNNRNLKNYFRIIGRTISGIFFPGQ